MDGLAPSVTALAAISVFVISLYNRQFLISILSLSLAGSLMGFLRYNWEPAQIYLGDSGSMFLGMVIGALTILGDYSTYNDLAFISGFFILSFPIFDMIYVMTLRLIKGRSPFFGSPDHLALRLKKKFGLTAAQTVCGILIVQLLLTLVVFVNFYSHPTLTIITSLAIVLFFAMIGIWLAEEKME